MTHLTSPQTQDRSSGDSAERQVAVDASRRAAGYIRVGSGPADMQACCLDEQIASIEAHALVEGFEYTETYSDLDMGIIQQRPGLMRLISAAELGKFEVVIMSDPTRLFRVQELLDRYVFRLERQYGIQVVFLDDQYAEEMAQ